MQTALDLIFMALGIGLFLVHFTGVAEIGIPGLLGGGACIVFGLFRLQRLWQFSKALSSELLQDERVIEFYETTQRAWARRRLEVLGAAYEAEGHISYDAFVKKYPPIVGSALDVFFREFLPRPGEFMIGLGDSDARSDSGWFVLTNFRVIQKDGRDGVYREIEAGEIVDYETSGTWKKTLRFTLRNGEVEEFTKVDIFPAENFVNEMRRQAMRAER